MATAQLDIVIRRFRRAALDQDDAVRTDAQLLKSVIDQKDESAFEVLVHRHGPMVFGVCRRIARNHHDAEDAFQATFLVLARKAASVRPREKVANWLYGVAFRTAMKTKTMSAKRRGREKQVSTLPECEAAQQDHWTDLQPILDQELNGLPENYRLPIILCDLEGKTIKEATLQLGWPQGTLACRLARGRKVLAQRLTERGVVLSAGSVTVMIAQHVAAARVPHAIVNSTIKTANLILAGEAAVAGVVSARVAALMEGVTRTMLLTRIRTFTVFAVVLTLVAFGGELFTRHAALGQAKPDKEFQNGKAEKASTGVNRVQTDLPASQEESLQGTWHVVYAETFHETLRNGERIHISAPQSIKDTRTYTFSPEEILDLRKGKWGSSEATYVLDGDVMILRTISEQRSDKQDRVRRTTLQVLSRTSSVEKKPSAQVKRLREQSKAIDDADEDFRTPLYHSQATRHDGLTTYLSMPQQPPSEATILKACPDRTELGKDLRVYCELIKYQLGEARFYPLVGKAQLATAHFQCLVQGSLGQRVIYIDRDVLVLADGNPRR